MSRNGDIKDCMVRIYYNCYRGIRSVLDGLVLIVYVPMLTIGRASNWMEIVFTSFLPWSDTGFVGEKRSSELGDQDSWAERVGSSCVW